MSSTITVDSFGKTKNGEKVTRYTFTNNNGVTIRIIDFGCSITEILLPNKDPKDGKVDINLGFDKIEDYENITRYFGAVCGRVCNIVSGGKFTLEGEEYKLARNYGGEKHSVHGGLVGFDKVMWESKVEGDKVILRYVSKDGEEGYPGNLTATVTYSLDDNNAFTINYHATTDKATPINFTNHAYVNLAGHGTETLEGHNLQVIADHVAEYGEVFMPTGMIVPVDSSNNLKTSAPVVEKMGNAADKRSNITQNYIVGENEKMKYIARLEHLPSRRAMEIESTEVCLQVYTAEYMDETIGKNGAKYKPCSAISLEPMHIADSVNHANFPSTILHPGEIYNQTTVYRFVTLAE